MPVINYSSKKYQLFAHKPYTHLEENILAHKYICVSAVCDQPQGKRRPCNLNKKIKTRFSGIITMCRKNSCNSSYNYPKFSVSCQTLANLIMYHYVEEQSYQRTLTIFLGTICQPLYNKQLRPDRHFFLFY